MTAGTGIPARPAVGTAGMRCRGWRQESLLRMLENVMHVAEDPDRLIVYASLGKAARDWPSYKGLVDALQTLGEHETLLVQSGKPIGRLRTGPAAPLVIMANCNLVGRWATPETFYDLADRNLICWGGLTAGDWQYIGSQGVIQGTYEILSRIAEHHFGGSLAGRRVLTAGLGGMGGAQPLAGRMAGAAILVVEVDPDRLQKRLEQGFLDGAARDLDEALARIDAAAAEERPLSVGLHGNAADIFPAILARGIVPDIVTDQTAAHDLIHGYIPSGLCVADAAALRRTDPDTLHARSAASIIRHVTAMLGFQKAGSVVFDNGNLSRSQAAAAGIPSAFDIPVFTEAWLRPLFCRGIGPFRWVALSGDAADLARIDDLALEMFPDDPILTNWIHLARAQVPIQGYPARIAWLGHGQRTALARRVNALVRDGRISAPVAFTRDHLDAGAMAHPTIMTENLQDGSDAIADWPLLNAMVACGSGGDLVAIHSGGGGYAGFMTSAGLTVIADGSDSADQRLDAALTNDTATGVLRYADAGYPEALAACRDHGIARIALNCPDSGAT